MTDLHHTAHDTSLRFHPTSAEEIIVRAQDILGGYFVPDSGQTAQQTLDQLRELFDSPVAFEIYDNVMARREGGYRQDLPQH